MKNLKTFEAYIDKKEFKKYNSLQDVLDEFDNPEIDWVETNIDDFVHDHPEEDFDGYILNDETINKEKEIIANLDNGEELFIYTDINDNVHGIAFNID